MALRWDEDLGGARVVLTDRRSGASRPPYDGANLGGHVGDDPGAVEANREGLARVLGVPRERLLLLDQVHGAEVVHATGPWAGAPPRADGLVTGEPGLALTVLVADCTPVLLADPAAGVVGAAHAGRPGLLAGVVGAVVAAMRDLGATRLVGRLGPSVCGRCYEVPPAMADEVVARVPRARAVSAAGTPALDVAAGVLSQLEDLGVDAVRLAGCTREDPQLYSYRRDGTTGRSAGAVVLA